MCLIALALKTRPGTPLLLLGNRDEFYARPSAQADWWPDKPDILGGRDLVAGGSWLAVRRDGHVAAVTNYRDPPRRFSGDRSRGQLVREYLAGHYAPSDYARRLEATRSEYAGYSLLFGHAGELWFFSNRGGAAECLSAGVYGLSNHLLNSPWPKVSRLRKRLANLPPDMPADAALLELLRDTRSAHDKDLPDTGVGLEQERALSAAFIQLPGYGTRSSALLRIADDGRAHFEERGFGPDGASLSGRKFEFTTVAKDVLTMGVRA